MATIRLHQVTRTFAPGATTKSTAPGYQEDPALAATTAPTRALDTVSLTVPEGRTLVALGPSGCGKSTLLRVVAGLDMEYSGQIFYDDQPMETVPPKDRYLGMVFQNYALYPHFAGRGNLAFFFKVRKLSDPEAEERIRITSEIMGVGFNQLLQHKPGTLSGGQQQRVAIARAIVRRPRLFLFDEPLSNLDAKLRVQTRVEIKRLLRRFAITAIYVTHDQQEAQSLADLVAVMRDGRLEQLGAFQEILAQPANTFVASFLGVPPMNILTEGQLLDGAIRFPDGPVLPLPASVPPGIGGGSTVTVGFRPEAARILGERDPLPAQGIWQGVVEAVEPDFGRQQQTVYLTSGPHRYAVMAGLNLPLALHQRVDLTLDPTQLHWFDPATGQHIVIS